MKSSLLILVLLFQMLGNACIPSNKSEQTIATTNENLNARFFQDKEFGVPNNWEKVEDCGLSFFAPDDLKEVIIQPIDSCAKKYRNQNNIIDLDLVDGAVEFKSRQSEYAGNENFTIKHEIINGLKGEIITYYSDAESGFNDREGLFYGAVLSLHNYNQRSHLTIWAYSRNSEERENVIKIFKTIKFDEDFSSPNSN